jgi:hypothetical protein
MTMTIYEWVVAIVSIAGLPLTLGWLILKYYGKESKPKH